MKYINKFLSKIFIDNPYLCYYGCHRNPKRSFFIENRQFNVCSRCTGILSGLILGCLTLYINIPYIQTLFLFNILFNLIDGLTQLLKFRESNNSLRLFLGLSFGILFIHFLKVLI